MSPRNFKRPLLLVAPVRPAFTNMVAFRRLSQFFSLAIALVGAYAARVFLPIQPLGAPVPDLELMRESKVLEFCFGYTYAMLAAEAVSLFLLFTSLFLLNASLWNAFLLLLVRIVFQPCRVDAISILTNLTVSIIAITVVLMPTQFPVTLLVAVLGLLTAFCTVLIAELFALALLAFFSLLFFWLRNHKIGMDDARAAPNAMKTVVVFMVMFGVGFYAFSMVMGYPKISREFWSATSTIHVLPILQSKLAMSALPAFFPHHEPQKLLLAFTCVLCSEFFRFIPIATEGAQFANVVAVSAKLMDVGALLYICGSCSRFTGVYSLLIMVTIYLACYFLRI